MPVCHVGGRGFKSRLFRFMFFRLNNYKSFILFLLIFCFAFYFGFDITQLQFNSDLISSVESDLSLDPVIEDSNNIES